MSIRPLQWTQNTLRMLDQRELPQRETWLELTEWRQVADAITDMAVRGAPAIGVAAAFGMALAAQSGNDLDEAYIGLAASRPTAVNLFWALNRIKALATLDFETILAEAKTIEAEDVQANLAIGFHGSSLLQQGARIMTICNTGALATAGHGTALGIIRTAHYDGNPIFVYSCETRPRLQGLKLTAWELKSEGIPFESIVDGAAGSLMATGKVDCVIAGADRIAKNGDAANKIGTYALAVLAHHHGIPFYIAAPSSTIDTKTADGSQIPIEQRDASEVTQIANVSVAPDGISICNPAFDVTPNRLITAIITEEGVSFPPYCFS